MKREEAWRFTHHLIGSLGKEDDLLRILLIQLALRDQRKRILVDDLLARGALGALRILEEGDCVAVEDHQLRCRGAPFLVLHLHEDGT